MDEKCMKSTEKSEINSSRIENVWSLETREDAMNLLDVPQMEKLDDERMNHTDQSQGAMSMNQVEMMHSGNFGTSSICNTSRSDASKNYDTLPGTSEECSGGKEINSVLDSLDKLYRDIQNFSSDSSEDSEYDTDSSCTEDFCFITLDDAGPSEWICAERYLLAGMGVLNSMPSPPIHRKNSPCFRVSREKRKTGVTKSLKYKGGKINRRNYEKEAIRRYFRSIKTKDPHTLCSDLERCTTYSKIDDLKDYLHSTEYASSIHQQKCVRNNHVTLKLREFDKFYRSSPFPSPFSNFDGMDSKSNYAARKTGGRSECQSNSSANCLHFEMLSIENELNICSIYERPSQTESIIDKKASSSTSPSVNNLINIKTVRNDSTSQVSEINMTDFKTSNKMSLDKGLSSPDLVIPPKAHTEKETADESHKNHKSSHLGKRRVSFSDENSPYQKKEKFLKTL